MSTSLPVNVDSTYADRGPGDAAHQQHHDEIHEYTNDHDGATDPHGDRAHAETLVGSHEGDADPHPLYLLESDASAAYVSKASVVSASVATSQGTTGTTFADLATAGPAQTVTVGASGRVLVVIGAQMANSNAGAYAQMGVAVSGATTRNADNAAQLRALVSVQSATAGQELASSRVAVIEGLAAGSTTFTTKYRAAGGGTATFAERHLVVIPLD